MKNKIRKSLNFIVKDLQLVDGLIHTQLIVNDEDLVIEIPKYTINHASENG